jgi:hypothetical protein
MPEYGFYGFPVGGRIAASSLLTGMVAYWKLDETSGTRFDSYGANHLSVNGTITSGAGKFGNASVFGSGLNYHAVSSALSPNGASRSISAWVYMTSSTSAFFLESGPGVGDSGGTPLWIMKAHHGGSGGPFAVYHGGNYRSGTTVASTNTWYHVVYTYNISGASVGLWINGVREVNINVADANTGTGIYIGAPYSDYQGSIDEVGIWNRELTSGEIATLYNAGLGVTYPLFG